MLIETAHHKPTGNDLITKKISHHPLALLFYALSHHLAKQLQIAFNSTQHEDLETITYMLIPVFANPPNGQALPAFQLRSYVFCSNAIDKESTPIFFTSPVDEDLQTYWQTHHQDCLSAISDEPDDSIPVSTEPADQ